MIFVADYWPEIGSFTYRRANGTYYGRTKFIAGIYDPMRGYVGSIPGIHFALFQYFAAYGSTDQYNPDERFDNSWSMLKPGDGSVIEIADSWPPAGWNSPAWGGGGPGQYYATAANITGIFHGRPGGHELDEPPFIRPVNSIWRSEDYQHVVPTFLGGYTCGTVLYLASVFDLYTPPYGRKNGIWGAGQAKTYADVICLTGMQMTQPPTSPAPTAPRPVGCDAVPAFAGFYFRSYWARGVGMVEQDILYYEHPAPGGSINCYLDDPW